MYTAARHDDRAVTLDQAWFDSFERLRLRVLRELACRGVVIESCPTSNRVVANIEGDDGPLQAFVEFPGLRCAIGTDDPGLLDAWPAEELQRAKAQQGRLLRENRRASFVRVHAAV